MCLIGNHTLFFPHYILARKSLKFRQKKILLNSIFFFFGGGGGGGGIANQYRTEQNFIRHKI